MQFAETLVQNAIGFDKVGIDLDFSGSNPDSCTRDLMQISSMIDRLSISSRPITITSIKVPSEQNGCKGFWRDNWSENTQSVFLKALYKILIGKTQIDSISYGNFVDNSQPTGLLRLSGEPKASFKTIRSIKNFLNE